MIEIKKTYVPQRYLKNTVEEINKRIQNSETPESRPFGIRQVELDSSLVW
jgi:hypothetical protein